MPGITTPRPSVVLLLGCAGVGKKTLLKGIFGGPSLPPNHVTELSDVRSYFWTIDTKYYSTDVEVWVSRPAPDIISFFPSQSIRVCEAMILTFDLNQESSFDAIRRFWEDFEEKNSSRLPEVLLCVGNKRCEETVSEAASPAEQQPEHEPDEGSDWEAITRSDYRDWCFDHGFEYVETDFSVGPVAPLRGIGREGVARVREALQCNTCWRSMHFKPSAASGVPHRHFLSSSNGIPGTSSASQSESESEPEEAGSGRQDEDGEGSCGVTSHVPTAGPDATQHNRDGPAQRDVMPLPLADENPFLRDLTPTADSLRGDVGLTASSSGWTQGGSSGYGDEAASGDDKLEETIDWLRKVRSAGADLPDEERRERAAQAALTLWSLIGDDEEGSGSSSAEDED